MSEDKSYVDVGPFHGWSKVSSKRAYFHQQPDGGWHLVLEGDPSVVGKGSTQAVAQADLLRVLGGITSGPAADLREIMAASATPPDHVFLGECTDDAQGPPHEYFSDGQRASYARDESSLGWHLTIDSDPRFTASGATKREARDKLLAILNTDRGL